MENKGTDYKKRYEETLLALSENEQILAEKEEVLSGKDYVITEKDNLITEKDYVIADLGFELDKLRKYIFGFKSEKRNGSTAADGQMYLFELGVTQSVQEELS